MVRKIDMEKLIEMYQEEVIPMKSMAVLLGCGVRTLRKRIGKIPGIKRRSSHLKNKVGTEMGEVRERIYQDTDCYEFMSNILHGELRSMYWKFVNKKPETIITFDKLIKKNGSERARILKKYPEIKEMYIQRTQRIK